MMSSGDKIKAMENEPKNNIQAMWETAGEFVDVRIDLLKLQAIKKSSDIISSVVSSLVMVVVLLLFIILISIGLALFIGELLGKSYYGFFALAGFYLIVGLIFNSLKNKLVKAPVADILIKKMFK